MSDGYFDHPDTKRVSVPLWMVRALADNDGSANWNAAALLQQITWWLSPDTRTGEPHANHSHDGQNWLVRTDEEWATELSMSTKTVARARRRLVERGWVECRRMRCRCFGSETRTVMHLRRLYPEISTGPEDGSLTGPKVQLEEPACLDKKSSSQVDKKSSQSAPSPSISKKVLDNSFVESASAASPSESKKVDYDGSGDPPSVEAVRLKRLPFPPQFAECWNLYPKRCDHDKLGAYKAWRARVVEAPKAGVGRPERMGNLLWAVRGYVFDCEEEDRAEEFMKNASTFFGAANDSVLKYCARLARQRYADPDEPEVEPEPAVRSCAPLVGVGAGTGPPGRNGASTGHTGAAEGTGT